MLRKVHFFLQNHPFPVEAFFERSLVLTFAVPVAELRDRVPACLGLDTFEDRLGFVAVAMVDTRDLRPRGFPRFLGNDFFLIGYRIFVRYRNGAGRRQRGLYILRSETDKRRMEVLGSVFTRYRYARTDVACRLENGRMAVTAPSSGFSVVAEIGETEVPLPSGSPFSNWKEARRFSGPLPFTFSYNEELKQVVTVQGRRGEWNPRPVRVVDWRIPFLETLRFKEMVLANAFVVEKVPYQWSKGIVELWKG